MDSKNLVKLKEIFAIVMELDEGNSPEHLTRVNFYNSGSPTLEKWDSLAHVSLLAALESEFGLTFGLEDFERLTSFKAIVEVLTEKGL